MIEFGYKVQCGMVELHEVNSKAIVKAFNGYLDTLSLYKTKEILDTSPYFSPNGNKIWTRSTIRKILSNQLYLGNDLFPQLIQSEIFEKVNQLLSVRGARVSKGIQSRKTHTKEYYHDIYCFSCKKPLSRCLKRNVLVYTCACGKIIKDEFINKCFNALINGLNENRELIEVNSQRLINSFELMTKDQQIETLLDKESYSHLEIIQKMKERASLAYSLCSIEKSEQAALLIIKALSQYDIQENNRQVFNKTIKKCLVIDSTKVIFKLINDQEFEIAYTEEAVI